MANRASQLRKQKQLCDKVDKELTESVDMLPQLSAKGYPIEMTKFLQGKIDEVKAALADTLASYGAEISKPEGRVVSCDLVLERASEVERVSKSLETLFNMLKAKHLTDLRKLAA